MNELHLVEVRRDAPASSGQIDRARYVAWLSEPLTQLDFVVDGVTLSEQLRTFTVQPELFRLDPFDMLSVADLAWPGEAAGALWQLAGVEERSEDWPLALGRLPLYVCPVCAGLGCGAITVEVVHQQDAVVWRDFRMENGHTRQTDMMDLGMMGPMAFDAARYINALLAPVSFLDAVVKQEQEARRGWQEGRGVRGILSRLRKVR